MKTIPSFTIDHIRLLRGIYVSRKDQVGGDTVTTFDIRMKEPANRPWVREHCTPSNTWPPPSCVTILYGVTKLSTGDRWVVSLAIIY